MESRKTHQTSPSVSASVRVGAYALEVGTPAGSFAQFEAANEQENARALAAALAAEPSRPVAEAEAFHESAAAVTKRVEQTDDLFRAAAEGRLDDLDSVSGEIDLLLAVLKRLDGAGRFEEELRLLRALHGLLAVSLRWLDLIRALRRGLAASEATADRSAEAWIRHELGALHLAAGDAKTAAGRFAEALRLKEQLGDVTGRCATRHNLDCAERDLARASAPPGRPRRTARQWAFVTAFPLVALVLGVAAGRFQPSGNDDSGAGPAETQQTTTVSQPRPPEALDDDAATDEDVELSIPTATLLRNDEDSNGDDLTVTAVERVERRTHGRVALQDDEVVYTPARNYAGPARFRYRISDGEGGTAMATVRILVEAVNDAPRARPDTLSLSAIAPTTVDVLANDRDVDGGELVVLGETNGLRGSVSCSPDGACTYTPGSREIGLDTFTYTVGDGNGGETIGLVTVTVEPLPEVSIGDADAVTEPGQATFTLTLSAPSSSTVEVAWETGEHPDGASVEGKDFGQASGTVIFEPGEIGKTITVEIYADESSEGDETFFVRLLDAVGAELGKDTGVGTIQDPEPGPEPVL
ncbi:MAG: Ig-like domain-containing protein, partial [Gaiellaceae bacterium]